MDKKIIIFLVAIVALIVAVSGCTETGENTTTNNSANTGSYLEQNIEITNVTIKKAEYGDGYDIALVLKYNGDKPINGRLGIEPIPMYGETMGESEIGDYKSLPGGITQGQSFKIEQSDVGGFVDDVSGITGFKFKVGAEYTVVEGIYLPEEVFYTQVYPINT